MISKHSRTSPGRRSRRSSQATHWLCVAIGILMIPVAVPVAAAAQASDPDVEASEALRSVAPATWYDRESGDYAPPRVGQEPDNPIRHNGWVKTPAPASEWDFWPDWNFRWPSINSSFFSSLVLFVLGALLVTVIVLVTWYSLKDYVPSRHQRSKKSQEIKIDPARVADLPFDLQTTTMQDPLAEAKRLRAAGRYDQAIVCLYGYQLLALDRERRIHLQKGKTNRMYLRELDEPQAGVTRTLQGPSADTASTVAFSLSEIVQATMLVFEESFFGKHRISQTQFERVWSQLDQFHSLLANTASPAPTAAVRGGKAVPV